MALVIIGTADQCGYSPVGPDLLCEAVIQTNQTLIWRAIIEPNA